MLRRISKMLAALGTGVGLTVIVQLLMPPALIHAYGVKRYGEWLVLAGTVSYLSSLNFGITTYASNQLTMLCKRGDLVEYKKLQATTLAMLLCVMAFGAAVVSIAVFLPLTRIFHLTLVPPREASWMAFLLGMYAMLNVFAGYYNNLFIVVQRSHTGRVWSMVLSLASSLSVVTLAAFRLPFSLVAAGQLAAGVVVTVLTVADLKRRMGSLPLGIAGADWATAKTALVPSGMFAMILTQQFLLFQAPVIMLNWILGPETVVLFSICRTVLSTARQLLQTITTAIAPEITFSFAERNMKKLLDIFHYSEKVVFAVIPVANLGALLASPLLLTLWLHKPNLFNPYVYGMMALISGAMSMRDHKQFFQFATNTHKRLALIVFFGNILMIAVSIPFTMEFGLYGFMGVWLLSELSQMGLIYHENKKLFHHDPSINFFPVIKLMLVMFLSLPLCIGLVTVTQHRSLMASGLTAAGGTMLLAIESYFVFGLKSVWRQFRMRARGAVAQA